MNLSDLIDSLFINYKHRLIYNVQDEPSSVVNQILKSVLHYGLPKCELKMKNSKDSIRYREKGNRYFVAGCDTKAIKCYTKSLAYADTQELMAYAYGNRSASLYRMKMVKECLMDIDAALSLGYPKEKQKKLIDRRAKVLMDLQRIFKIKVTSPDDEKFSEKKNCGSPEKKMEEKIYKAIMMETEDVKQPRHITDEGQPKLIHGPSKEAPVASDGVRIAYSEEFGRHFVATKVFNPGDILMIEEPYAYCILPERFYTHCHYCLRQSYHLIPCSVCPIAQYCSAKCRTAAWNSVHRLECPIFMFFKSPLICDSSAMVVCMRSLRFLITATEGGKAIEELRQDMELADLNKDKRTAGFTAEGILDTASARSALSLATNATEIPVHLISRYAYLAAVIALLLATRTNFFGKQSSLSVNLVNDDIFRDLVFCGAVLFRAALMDNTNSFSIFRDSTCISGHGLYVVNSLFNHSCSANTFWHFNGLTLINRALRRIRPGEQIFISYVAAVYMSKLERQCILKHKYHMDCKCVACLEDWPTDAEIANNLIDFTFLNANFFKTLKAVSVCRPFLLRIEKNKYDIEAIKGLLLCLFDANLTKPCGVITFAEHSLVHYYRDM